MKQEVQVWPMKRDEAVELEGAWQLHSVIKSTDDEGETFFWLVVVRETI